MSELKVWVTKFVFTEGIEEVDAEQCSPTMVAVRSRQWTQYVHKPFWHTSREDAVAHAEKMRIAKLASLKKSMEKIQKLEFK
jgi:hypothetical protein